VTEQLRAERGKPRRAGKESGEERMGERDQKSGEGKGAGKKKRKVNSHIRCLPRGGNLPTVGPRRGSKFKRVQQEEGGGVEFTLARE